MGIPSDDVVLIQNGKSSVEPCVITVNCPDKAGLGCDLCRIVLEFGLCIVKGDVSTDGRWCYIVLWVILHPHSPEVDWESLKSRLSRVCPSCLLPCYLYPQSGAFAPSSLYLLKFLCLDRKGFLHDVAKVLYHLELLIQRMKVTTTPDGSVLDLFFITDGMELLHTKERQNYVRGHLNAVLGEHCISCELELAGPQYQGQQEFSTLPPAVAEELFGLHGLSPNMTKLEQATITVDEFFSQSHSLLQIHCLDQKNLLYDIMRTSKDCNIKIAYGRFSSSTKGWRDVDLFIKQTDGERVVGREARLELCSRLKEEMVHPLRVIIADRGPDTELLVANPVELSGKGRPRVFYDVICALKALGVCIFSAEIGRHSTSNRQWEFYRFLLNESQEFPCTSRRARSRIVDRVRRTLMGW